MKPRHPEILGIGSALCAILLIAWMCFESWGGLSPF